MSRSSTRPTKRLLTNRVKRRKVIVEFPSELLERTEAAAQHLSTNRSKVIRSAVEQFLSRLERSEFEQQLIEGYQANGEVDRRIAAEFIHIDTEGA